jgi:hypothetical protein
MKHFPDLPPLDWVWRVNSTWIVHGKLNEHAASWLNHLATLDDDRLIPSCEIARAMCEIRNHLGDPKPWFYAGLFSLATDDEARRFLASHPITKASIPALKDDMETARWMDQIGPETQDLISRLRQALARILQERHP